MKLRTHNQTSRSAACRAPASGVNGSVLVIVLWVAFGLVSLALYFANTSSLELRAADNRVAGLEAEQAIAGAARYVSNILVNLPEPGMVPDTLSYLREAVPVGDAMFWLIGRDNNNGTGDRMTFGLVDEASKLNLNIATTSMLEKLPGVTSDMAAAIVDWRDADSDVTPGGAEDDTYQRLNPPYRCKNAPFETVDELRLVYGMTNSVLFGEDANLNGYLDPNENDGESSQPSDNQDGLLNPGLFEFVTVYSRESNTRTNGSQRINVGTPNAQQIESLLNEKGFKQDRIQQIVRRLPTGPGAAPITSILEFYLLSGMTVDEFTQIEGDISTTNAPTIQGLVNVNTASATVLGCIPGIGTNRAMDVVTYRQSNADATNSVAWVAAALNNDANAIRSAGPYLTGRSYQFTADIAAVGHYGRGYQRTKFIFDTSEGTPKIRLRQDLTQLGWALGPDVRNNFILARDNQR